jgi:hypothetical protein
MPLGYPGIAVRRLTTPPVRAVVGSAVVGKDRASGLIRIVFSKEPLERLARPRERFASRLVYVLLTVLDKIS